MSVTSGPGRATLNCSSGPQPTLSCGCRAEGDTVIGSGMFGSVLTSYYIRVHMVLKGRVLPCWDRKQEVTRGYSVWVGL